MGEEQPISLLEEIALEAQLHPTRLSDLQNVFECLPSRKGLKKAIDKGRVLINGRRAKTADIVVGGEVLALLPEEKNRPVLKIEIPLVYEDDHLAIVNKPAGIATSGNQRRTLVHALPHNLKISRATDAMTHPQPAHRLDFATCGLLIIGKTRSALSALNEMFASGRIEKTYTAIAAGDLPTMGEIDSEVDGSAAYTHYRRLALRTTDRYGVLSLVQLQPRTGRRNQLRIHLARIGAPILGDTKYSDIEHRHPRKGLFLQASRLRFVHPSTGKQMDFSLEPHKKFTRFFKDQDFKLDDEKNG